MTLQIFSSHVSGVLLCFFPSCFGLRKAPFFWGRFYTPTPCRTPLKIIQSVPQSHQSEVVDPPNQLHLFRGCFGTPSETPTSFIYFRPIYKAPQVRGISHHHPHPRTVSPPTGLSLCHANCQPSREFQVQARPPKGWLSSQAKRRPWSPGGYWGMGKSHLQNDGKSLEMGMFKPLRNWGWWVYPLLIYGKYWEF